MNTSDRPQVAILQISCNTFNYMYNVAYMFSLWFSVTLSELMSHCSDYIYSMHFIGFSYSLHCMY